MKCHGLRSFWKSMLGQRSPVEFAGGTGDSVATVGGSDFTAPGDISPAITVIVPALPLESRSRSVSDRKKTGATVLFSGIFLGLVGMPFTAMGWLNHDLDRGLEWTHLLGPVMLSAGGALVLISICKFRMLYCPARGRPRGEADDPEQITPDLSSVVHGVDRPTVPHGAAAEQNIPPTYASVTRDWNSACRLPRNLPPHYCTVCPLDYQVFTVEELRSHSRTAQRTGSRSPTVGEQLQGRIHQDSGKDSGDINATCTCPPPPSYEDIFPSGQTDRST